MPVNMGNQSTSPSCADLDANGRLPNAAGPPVYVTPPIRTPRKFGLYSVATVIDLTDSKDDHHAENGVQTQPYSCATAKPYAPACAPAVNPQKTIPIGMPTDCGSPIPIYHGFDCGPLGYTIEEGIQIAEQNLLLGEERAMEHAFWTGEIGNFPNLANNGAADLTGGNGPVSLNYGLALLEQEMATDYGGVGVIHAPAGAVSLMTAANLLCQTCEGDTLTTHLGNPLAAYGGTPNTSPTGAPAALGTYWIYVTGQIIIRRGQIFTSPNDPNQALNRGTNEVVVLSERVNSIWTECILSAVNVKAS